MLHTFWTPFIPIDGAYEVPEELSRQLPQLLEKLVFFSTVWGVGASTDQASRIKFDAYIRERIHELGLEEGIDVPKEGLVYDYAVVLESNLWTGWMDIVPTFELSPKTEFQEHRLA